MRLAAPLLLALLVATASASGSTGRSWENATTFRDAAGEDPEAPDITTVRVSNDDEGRIAFRIALSNRPTLRDDMRFSLSIDADHNAHTGLEGLGVDYRLLYDFYLHGDRKLWLLTCSASQCTSGEKLSFGYASGPTVTIDRTELGDTRRFRFWINTMDGIVFDPVARTFDDTKAHGDVAPDWTIGRWAYDVQIGPRKLLVEQFSTTPRSPVAGKTFVARLTVKRDDGARVTSGRVTCDATIGGARLHVVRRALVGGTAVCAWLVPGRASGRTLRATIALMFAGKKASRSFVKKVT